MKRRNPQFVKRFKNSHKAVWVVAHWFHHKLEKDVLIKGAPMAEYCTPEQEYLDDGDLYIDGKRVEVKGLTSEFTCEADYPYRDGVLVCNKASYDRADPKPYMYVELNKHMTHAYIVYPDTFDHWSVFKMNDKYYGENNIEEVYKCPLEHVIFRKVVLPDFNGE
jgi:hypothetical protein